MRKHLFLPAVFCLAACSLTPIVARAEDTRPPRVEIKDVVMKAVDGKGFFKFTVKARDNRRVIRLEYRLTLDGNRGDWKRTPYDDDPEKISFTVSATKLKFDVRAVDAAHNKSSIDSRTLTRAS